MQAFLFLKTMNALYQIITNHPIRIEDVNIADFTIRAMVVDRVENKLRYIPIVETVSEFLHHMSFVSVRVNTSNRHYIKQVKKINEENDLKIGFIHTIYIPQNCSVYIPDKFKYKLCSSINELDKKITIAIPYNSFVAIYGKENYILYYGNENEEVKAISYKEAKQMVRYKQIPISNRVIDPLTFLKVNNHDNNIQVSD